MDTDDVAHREPIWPLNLTSHGAKARAVKVMPEVGQV